MIFAFGGEFVTTAVDDIGEAVPPLLAVVTCGLAARRLSGRHRIAWGLIAASALSWGLGEVVWSIYEVGFGIVLPFPSPADAGFLLAIPLEIAAVGAFLTSTTRVTTRGRAAADGATIALSVLFIAWASVYQGSRLTPTADALTLAYPAGDIVTATLLILAVLRTPRINRGTFLLLLGGFAAFLTADGAFAYLNATGAYRLTNLVDTGWVLGYLLIALAPLSPVRSSAPVQEEGAIAAWQMVVTWACLAAVGVTAIVLTARGQPPDVPLAVIGTAVGVSLLAGQTIWYLDSSALLRQTKHAESVLRERTTLLNQVISHAPIGIARASTAFKIIDANRGLGSLLHEAPESIIGSAIARYVAREEQLQVFAQLRALMTGEAETVEAEPNLVRHDGSRVWTHLIAAAVKKPSGETDYFLAMLLDVDDRHRADQAAMANLEGLERLNRLKSEFVSMVSHEMRTALTGIQGFSEVMRDQAVTTDEVKEIAGDINTDAERLNRMITEMLDLDRLESGRTTLRLDAVNLNQTILQAVQRGAVLSSMHRINTELEAELPLVTGDEDRLFEVLTNLLSNAVKYSPGGEILVTSQVHEDRVRVSVRDHGRGIPADFIGRLFSRYERYEGDSKSKVIGTGLGLAICRQVIEMHKGRIWAVSTVGEGSEFHFEIPTRKAEASRGRDLERPAHRRKSERLTA